MTRTCGLKFHWQLAAVGARAGVLSTGVARMAETCTPVSTRKRRPVLSVINSCGSRGPAYAVATDGPPGVSLLLPVFVDLDEVVAICVALLGLWSITAMIPTSFVNALVDFITDCGIGTLMKCGTGGMFSRDK